MIKLMNVLGDSSDFDVNFSSGSYNLLVFEDEKLRLNLIRSVFEMCKESFEHGPYIISGFNLKPYLNVIDNIYVSFGIDLNIELEKRLVFKNYCTIFGFTNYCVEFDSLSTLDKLKGIFIASLFSGSKVILFDNSYPKEMDFHVKHITDLIMKFGVFFEKVFIEVRKFS